MNRKYHYYQQVKSLMEGLIALPETDADEDRTLRAILNMMTQMLAKQQEFEEPEVPEMPVQQEPEPSTQELLMRNFQAAQGGQQ